MLVSVVLYWIITVAGLDALNPEVYHIPNGISTTARYFGVKDKNSPAESERIVDHIFGSLQQIGANPVFVLLHDEAKIINIGLYMSKILGMNNKTAFLLMKFNATDVTRVVPYNVGSEKFIYLLKTKFTKATIRAVDYHGVVFASILKAVQLLPKNSGILLFVKEMGIDEDLAHRAVKAVADKNIKLFTVWQGLCPGVSKEEKLLREVTLMSHGHFFTDNAGRIQPGMYPQSADDIKATPTIKHKANNFGKRVFKFPIDEGASYIQISFTDTVIRAYLYAPRGYLIDLLDATGVEAFSKTSFIAKSGKTYVIHLDTARNARIPVKGIWNLQLEGRAVAQDYNVTVSIENSLILTSQIATKQVEPESSPSHEGLQLIVPGEFSKTDNVTINDKFGKPIASNITYKVLGTAEEEVIKTLNKQTVKINATEAPREPVYIPVNGKDKNGNELVRLNYIDSDIDRNKLQAVTIEVGLNSRLVISPGESADIFFEATNNLNGPITLDFMCNDVKGILHWMRPLKAYLYAHQTITVQLNIQAGSGSSYQDLITFSATSRQRRFQKSLMLEVSSTRIYDTSKPQLWHKFTSDCVNVLIGDCRDRHWTIEATTQDSQSGIFQLTSSPSGLHFSTDYVVGTKHRVTGYYTGSCCEPEIRLTSTDLMHNRRTYVANAYYPGLSAGAIAGIVIGILVVIVISILLIICLCKKGKCRRKKKDSLNVTTTSYRGPKNSATTTRY